jgi:hypothetical protein
MCGFTAQWYIWKIYKPKLMYRVLLFCLMSFSSFSQILPPAEPIPEEKPVEIEKPKPAWKERMHYGGNIWLGFWGSLYLDAAPMIGFDVTDKGTVAGVGASIIYSGVSRANGGGLSIGPRFFVRQKVWRTVFAHGEYELMNSNPYNFYDYVPVANPVLNPKNKWGATGYVGLGFYQNRMREQSGAFISVLYNLGAPNQGFIPQQRIDQQGKFVFRIGFFI